MLAPMPETKTKSFVNKQVSPTMNARAFEQSSNGTPETQMRKKLFNSEKNAKSCDFYLNPRHLGRCDELEKYSESSNRKLSSSVYGVWVAKWMIECDHKYGYDKIVVGYEIRLRVAIDLILHRYNKVKDLVIQDRKILCLLSCRYTLPAPSSPIS
ncbi:hypothetical protein RIF29_25085 [Crotalaria pallida]|uniref:Uncharacterized protein n=1 Tax=Crotalaria pallida TaxID=3830 RepID=A0AAN9HYZ6_CROPI